MKHRIVKAAVAVGLLASASTLTAQAANAGVVSGATGCPSGDGKNYVCIYNSDNFNNFMEAFHPTASSCDAQSSWTLDSRTTKETNSVRNRTPCYLGLFNSLNQCVELMTPKSEDGKVPSDRITRIDFYTAGGRYIDHARQICP